MKRQVQLPRPVGDLNKGRVLSLKKIVYEIGSKDKYFFFISVDFEAKIIRGGAYDNLSGQGQLDSEQEAIVHEQISKMLLINFINPLKPGLDGFWHNVTFYSYDEDPLRSSVWGSYITRDHQNLWKILLEVATESINNPNLIYALQKY
ncbi:MAG: hypothetical protein AAFP92_18375 [Bacteroidota bacterium]